MRVPFALLATTLAVTGCTDPAEPALDDATRPSAARNAAAAAPVFPDVLALPTGFSPEGIAAGRGTTLYVGSIPTGAIYRLDARTGAGEILVPAHAGGQAVGLAYDPRGDRLFVAGGFTGQGVVYDASTGARLAVYQLTAPGTGLVNDVTVLRDAVYFTESFAPVLYRVPLAPNGALPAAGAVETIPLSGDFVFVPGDFNANGLVATPGEKRLLVVNSATGALYSVDPRTGVAIAVDLGGATLPGGDGLVLVGRTLYVVQGEQNQVAVVRLAPDFASGTLERTITDPDFRIPSTAAELGSSLYVVNARFDVAPPPAPAPGVEFQVVRVPR